MSCLVPMLGRDTRETRASSRLKSGFKIIDATGLHQKEDRSVLVCTQSDYPVASLPGKYEGECVGK